METNMAKYADGFLIAIPKKKVAQYKKMAALGAKVWMKCGAVAYFECIGEDLNTKMGVPFPKILKTKAGETVVFSWIVYKSRTHRDKVNAKVMKDPMMNSFDPKDMPFDMKRMCYGGFEVLVSA
jgi:uncharacterized protein YbaA (DUF1428 family)